MSWINWDTRIEDPEELEAGDERSRRRGQRRKVRFRLLFSFHNPIGTEF
jgi:hypothetical protein